MHKNNTNKLIEGIKDLGLELLTKDEKFASPTLTAVHVPGKSKDYISKLAKRNIIVGGSPENIKVLKRYEQGIL